MSRASITSPTPSPTFTSLAGSTSPRRPLPFLLLGAAALLAAALPLGACGSDDSEPPPPPDTDRPPPDSHPDGEALDDDSIAALHQAALAAQVSGLSSSGVPNPMNAVDGSTATFTTVDATVGSCPGYNGGQFIKLNAGHCLFSGDSTTFWGWEKATLRTDNAGNVDAVELRFTHDVSAATAPVPQTHVYVSWDDRTYTRVGTVTGSTTRRTWRLNLVPPSRPAPQLHVILARSTSSAVSTLRWWELSASSSLAPSNLTARATSSSTVDLTWTDNAVSEADYEISMLDAGQWRVLGTVPANRTRETIADLRASTAYSFRVRARYATATSTTTGVFSNTAGATTLALAPVALRLQNSTHYPLVDIQVDNQFLAFNPQIADGTFIDLNDPTFLPGTTHSYVVTLQMPQERVTRSGSFTLGTTTNTLVLRLFAAQVAVLHGSPHPTTPGWTCDNFNNVHHEIDICATGTGQGIVWYDGAGPFTFVEPATWDADEIGFSFNDGRVTHQGAIVVYTDLWLDGYAYAGW